MKDKKSKASRTDNPENLPSDPHNSLFGSKKEQKKWQLHREVTVTMQMKEQIQSRQKLLKALVKGEINQAGGSTIDVAVKIAFSKHEELAATTPDILSGSGTFTGLRDVLLTSDRALNDVSSALKEVSAAVSGGDGAVLLLASTALGCVAAWLLGCSAARRLASVHARQ